MQRNYTYMTYVMSIMEARKWSVSHAPCHASNARSHSPSASIQVGCVLTRCSTVGPGVGLRICGGGCCSWEVVIVLRMCRHVTRMSRMTHARMASHGWIHTCSWSTTHLPERVGELICTHIT